jgi:iron(III) transport system substrate-binding protein
MGILAKARVIAFATACLLSSTAVRAGDVVVYSSNNSATIDAVVGLVAKNAPDLKIDIVRGKTGALLKRIDAESANPRSDIFWSGGFATLGAFQNQFQAHTSTATGKLPASMLGPDNLWVGTNVHVMVLMVNERQLKGLPSPTTWTDLFDPKWKGKVIMGDPEKSSSTYAQLYGIYKMFGRGGMAKLAASVINTGSSSNVYKSVAAGEFPVGITMEYSAQAYVAGGQKEIKLVYPSEGTFLSPEGMAMVKGAKNKNKAKQLMDFLASPQVQKAVFVATYRRPAHEGVDVSAIAGLPRMKDLKVFDYDQIKAAKERADVIKIWKEVIKEVR